MNLVMQQNTMKTWLLVYLAWAMWSGIWDVSVARASPRCYELFAKRLYIPAANCFQKAANQIPKNTHDRFGWGLRIHLLRNRAMSFLKASQEKTSLVVQSYHAEQTVKMIRWLLRKKLCSDELHCLALRRKAERIEASIRYRQLRVTIPRGKRVRVVIRGYRFRTVLHLHKPWTRKVRPGRYLVEYQYPQEKPRRYKVEIRQPLRYKKSVVTVTLPPPQPFTQSTKKVAIQPTTPVKREVSANAMTVRAEKKPLVVIKQPMVKKVAVFPKPAISIARKIPIVQVKPSIVGPVVLLSLAGAAVVTGGVLLGIGYGGAQQLQQETLSLRTQSGTIPREDQIAIAKSGQSASALVERLGFLETQATTGWVMASSGAAIGVAGVVWLLTQRKATQKPDPRSQILLQSQSSH